MSILKRVFRSEFNLLLTEIQQCKETNAKYNTELENLKSMIDLYAQKYEDEVHTHNKDLEEQMKLLQLQKLYCYLIPRLINSSGIEIPEDFDITNLTHAEKLYKRFRTGDLMNL